MAAGIIPSGFNETISSGFPCAREFQAHSISTRALELMGLKLATSCTQSGCRIDWASLTANKASCSIIWYALFMWLLLAMPTNMFSLHLVYLSTVACICEEINLDPCWHKDISSVKGQVQITKWYFFVHQCSQYANTKSGHQVAITIWCFNKYPQCVYFFGLSKDYCLHF